MSKPLSPEEQRQVRATYGTEVQSMDQMMAQCHVQLETISVEMRLKLAIARALVELDMGSPGRARETLINAFEEPVKPKPALDRDYFESLNPKV